MKKHEDEIKALKMAVQDLNIKLIERQELELQKQHVQGTFKIEKSNETDTERIMGLESEQEVLQETLNAQIEQTASDLLEDARKVAVQVEVPEGETGRTTSDLLSRLCLD